MPLDVDALYPDPVLQLRGWIEAAAGAGNPTPGAFAMATGA